MLKRNKPRKCKSDFDYGIYHKTGVKVSIERAVSSNMAEQKQLEEKKMLELQIFDDIQDLIFKTFQTNMTLKN